MTLCTRTAHTPMKAGWSLFGKMKGIIRRDRKIRESDREWAWLYCIVYVSHETMMFKYLSGSCNSYYTWNETEGWWTEELQKMLNEECACELASEPTDSMIPKLVILVSILFYSFTAAWGTTIYRPLYLQRASKRDDLWTYKLRSHPLSVTSI